MSTADRSRDATRLRASVTAGAMKLRADSLGEMWVEFGKQDRSG